MYTLEKLHDLQRVCAPCAHVVVHDSDVAPGSLRTKAGYRDERKREGERETLDPIGKMSFRDRDGDEKRNSVRLETRSTMLVFYFSLLLSSFPSLPPPPLAFVSLPLQQPRTTSACIDLLLNRSRAPLLKKQIVEAEL